ncbi:MAG: hypothetical protein H0X17_00215 [Deltaproteobacteria bacterium]|nr:hypothetical protein [Deltaproteobacteria bacterium]
MAGLAGEVSAQPRPRITVAIYAPSVEFGTSTSRLAYVQALAKAIEQNAGVQVDARSYANLAALKKDQVDFAIIDGPCYATNLGWKILATATIDGNVTRPWALYARAGVTMQELRAKKLAFIASGCRDGSFVDHAMLESEVDTGFFGARVGKPDLTAAVAEVAAVKTAHAVFAPVGAAKGLTKLFDTSAVPNPAFVDVGSKLTAATIEKVAAAVVSYGGGGAINAWTKPTREIYTTFAARLAPVTKTPMFATPGPVRIDVKDLMIEPPTLRDSAVVDVRHHYLRPRDERLE